MTRIVRRVSLLLFEVLDSTTKDDPGMRCMACTCPANYILFVLVSETDAKVVAGFGGKPARPDE
jgi:hypothetical protein